MMNRIWNAKNPNQGEAKRVLCLCSAGLLRSPTMARVLGGEPFNFNTRAAGVDRGHALIFADEVLLHWADEIVCATPEIAAAVALRVKDGEKLTILQIPDKYPYNHPELVQEIKQQYGYSLGLRNAR